MSGGGINFDELTDALAHQLFGAMMGVETHFEGELAVTGMVIDKALDKFLDLVADEAGEQVAAQYAKILAKGLARRVPLTESLVTLEEHKKARAAIERQRDGRPSQR